MSSGHRFGQDALLYTDRGGATIADRGTGTQIQIDRNYGVCSLTIAGAGETRTLPDPTVGTAGMGVGTVVTVVANQIASGGTCTINGTIFTAEGDTAVWQVLEVNGAKVWYLSHLRAGDNYVSLAVSTTITTAYSGRTVLLSGAGGARTMTMPAATGSGRRYRFMVAEVNTSNYVFSFSGATLKGHILTNSTADSPDLAQIWNGDGASTITLNGTTTGGALEGDWIEFEDFFPTFFQVWGVTTSSGMEATPFS